MSDGSGGEGKSHPAPLPRGHASQRRSLLVVGAVAAWLAGSSIPALAGEPATRPAAPGAGDQEPAPNDMRTIQAARGPAIERPLPPRAAWLASPAPLAVMANLSGLAAIVSCVVSIGLWRRVESGQEAAKASMYAAGKLFDAAGRRFSRSQDEAGSAVDAAASAAGQAGQAAARLAACVRDSETRLSSCLGEAEARLHAMTQCPQRLTDALDAAAALIRDGSQTLDHRAALISRAAEALPDAAGALAEATAAMKTAHAHHAALLARVEALAGVLPTIATSLASTAAGQRQLLAHGKASMEDGAAVLREAARVVSASLDDAAAQPHGRGEPPASWPSLHPALQRCDLSVPVPRGARTDASAQIQRHPTEEAVRSG